MKLLLDMGNTCIKWLADGGEPVSGVFEYHDQALPAMLDAAWSELTPGSIVAANVGGEVLGEQLAAWTEVRWGMRPVFLETTSSVCGVSNAYAEPENLGIDRWVALVGAHHYYQGVLCIIDCGSAVTVDVLAADGRHLGGLIMPGLRLQRQSLARDTARLPPMNNQPGQDIPGTDFASDTDTAILNGTRLMVAAAVDKAIEHVMAQQGREISILITGGDAPVIMPLSDHTIIHEPELVLKGIALIAEETECVT